MGVIDQATMYTTTRNVAVRLANKIQFQLDPANYEEGQLPNDLFLQLIGDAETAIEQDLRGRYAIPFKSIKKGNFNGLPDHTKRAIRMMADLKSCILILTTDFGSGTHLNSDPYVKNMKDTYDEQIELLMGRDKEAKERNRYRFTPPLDDLMLATSNALADDGYKGMVINTDADQCGPADYAESQTNDPSVSYFPTNRRISR